MKSLASKLTLFGAFIVGSLLLIQTVNSEPIEPDPNDLFLPLVLNPEILLKNGDFEAGAAHWGQYSSIGYWLILHRSNLPIGPRSGDWAAWMGDDYNESSIIWQEATIPLNKPILTYWIWIGSDDICGYDVGGVTININDAVDAYWLCSDNNTWGWLQRTVDLSGFAGQTVEIEFAAFNDETLVSHLFFDDITLGTASLDQTEIERSRFAQSIVYQTKHQGLLSSQDNEYTWNVLDTRLQLVTYLKRAAD